jgi:hypothetical protein
MSKGRLIARMLVRLAIAADKHYNDGLYSDAAIAMLQ